MRRSRGFTVVELVVSMVIATVVIGLVAMTIGLPIDSYLAQARRAELSDSAEAAMRFLGDDVRKALPDSLRVAVVNGSPVLEMIQVSGIANYRTAWTTGEPLQIGADDSVFDAVNAVTVSGPIRQIAVGHRNVNGTDIYAPTTATGVITPESIGITLNGGTRFTLTSPFRFTTDLPSQRAYLLSGVTRYECNTNSRELRRSRGTAIAAAASAVAPPFDVIASDVGGCAFRLRNGTAEHGGLVIVEMTISRAVNGNTESLRIFRQLKVENIS